MTSSVQATPVCKGLFSPKGYAFRKLHWKHTHPVSWEAKVRLTAWLENVCTVNSATLVPLWSFVRNPHSAVGRYDIILWIPGLQRKNSELLLLRTDCSRLQKLLLEDSHCGSLGHVIMIFLSAIGNSKKVTGAHVCWTNTQTLLNNQSSYPTMEGQHSSAWAIGHTDTLCCVMYSERAGRRFSSSPDEQEAVV